MRPLSCEQTTSQTGTMNYHLPHLKFFSDLPQVDLSIESIVRSRIYFGEMTEYVSIIIDIQSINVVIVVSGSFNNERKLAGDFIIHIATASSWQYVSAMSYLNDDSKAVQCKFVVEAALDVLVKNYHFNFTSGPIAQAVFNTVLALPQFESEMYEAG